MARLVRTAIRLTLAAFACLGGTAPAGADPGSRPTAAVALGDSFISGEGGRWLGNSADPSGDRDGTDRAAFACGPLGCHYEAARVYGATAENGCHRSDTAPIESPSLDVDRRVNLACSGARIANVRAGGEAHRGEAPQADRLARVARRLEVELVVVTVGANDFGFGRLVAGCVLRWLTTPASDPRPCAESAQRSLEAAAGATVPALEAALRSIRRTMRAAGYRRRDWRLVVAGYASPLPRGSALRDPEGGWARLRAGCPVWDADADWAKRVASPFIAELLRSTAAEAGAGYLDLSRILAGHELCHRAVSPVTRTSAPAARTAEWVRAIAPGQGSIREALHPNAYGQRAIGRCLALVLRAPPGEWRCERRGPSIGSAELLRLRGTR